MFNLKYYGMLPYVGQYSFDGYIANNDNFGATAELVIFQTQTNDFNSFMGAEDNAGVVISVGAGFDEIQAYTEKSVYLRAGYSFQGGEDEKDSKDFTTNSYFSGWGICLTSY